MCFKINGKSGQNHMKKLALSDIEYQSRTPQK